MLPAPLRSDSGSVSLERVAASIAHAIRNPLGAAITSLDSLARRLDAMPAEGESLGRARAALDRIARCVDELVELAAPRAAAARPVALGAWARREAPLWRARAEREGRTISIDVDDALPAVVADPALLARACDRLLEDSLATSPLGSPIRVEAALEDGRLALAVSDRRPDAAPAPEAFTLSGRGLGLTSALARSAVSSFGAEIGWARRGAETRASISLALAEPAEAVA
ncbi:MAG TPA: histidine kinase dimerization/phospho-acceptor domain-containing protein [Planctomycetota bacterium]|nr:histidine kinase dimerization/phospho-acceptor domain-containing protein [Planctomycetota bacterium]